MKKFENKTVIITGASSGIGLSLAESFISEGANVVAVARNKDKLDSALKGMPSDRLRILAGDASDERTALRAVSEAIELGGHLDILVNGVGNNIWGTITDLTTEEFNSILKTNVSSVFSFSKASIPALVRSHGTIINISSIQSFEGDFASVAYNSSKAALNNLTQSMSLDYAKVGVRINAVAPGFIDTPRTQKASEEIQQAYIDITPLKRAGTGKDVANAVMFLASEEASYITGVILPVDGGRMAGGHGPRS